LLVIDINWHNGYDFFVGENEWKLINLLPIFEKILEVKI
jgi:hypothetical protein